MISTFFEKRDDSQYAAIAGLALGICGALYSRS